MTPFGSFARILIGLGAILVVLGVLLLVSERYPALRVGRLPGDLRFERGNFSFYFPLGTSIVVSVVLTLVLWLLGRR